MASHSIRRVRSVVETCQAGFARLRASPSLLSVVVSEIGGDDFSPDLSKACG
jgi:hypothetical protein